VRVACELAVDPASLGCLICGAIARKTLVRRIAIVTPATAPIIAMAISSNAVGACLGT
jgi:hypothetical protein